MAEERRDYLLFLMEDEAQIKGCMEDGFEGHVASCTLEEGCICLTTTDGARITAVSVAREDEKRLSVELNALWNRFRAVETEHSDVKTSLLQQLRLCQALYTFDSLTEGAQEETVTSGLMDTCYNGGGLLLNGEKEEFRDEDGRVILNVGGESDLEFYEVRELPAAEPEGTSREALERRSRTWALLRERHIHSPNWLPALKDRPDSTFPDRDTTTRRLIALTLSALYSDGITGQQWSPKQSRRYLAPALKTFGAEDFFSPKERVYLDLAHPVQDVVIEYSWNYEHAWVLFWALGFTESLDFPDHVCDTAALADTVKSCPSFEALAGRGTLRSRDELLDAADLYFRYNWAVLDVCGQIGAPAPAQMDPGVVFSRHKALSWLTGGGAWDEISAEL